MYLSATTLFLEHSPTQNYTKVKDLNRNHLLNLLVDNDVLFFVTSISAVYISDVLQVAMLAALDPTLASAR